MSEPKPASKPYVLPILIILAVLLVLVMLRLAVWQLDRAQQRQAAIEQITVNSQRPISWDELLLSSGNLSIRGELDGEPKHAWLQFRPLTLEGQYLAEHSILIENQVYQGKGGYRLLTPFQPQGSDRLIMVSRGWLPMGETRQALPSFNTPNEAVTVQGQLVLPFAKPPLWKEGHPVNEGSVWQYLPIDQYAKQIGASVLPLMLELAPQKAGSDGLVTQWKTVDVSWVNKHKAYALQWFAMALVFFVLCLLLLFRRFTQSKHEADLTN